MSMTYDDIARDKVLEELHGEEVMRLARLSQCIYLFVEGDSEEQAIPILLDRCNLDLEELGVAVANYNGIGNLHHALRLLSNTLSHDRPVVITFDNDKEGLAVENKLKNMMLNKDIFNLFKIPAHSVVNYGAHRGGSFEESFEIEDFIDSCFSVGIMQPALIGQKNAFMQAFDQSMPWYSQVIQFCDRHEYHDFARNKVLLAEHLAENCKTIPETYKKLSGLLIDIRNQNPVKHPEDVELPNIKGLTC